MTPRIIYHVTKNNGHWEAKKSGNKIPTLSASSKKDVVNSIITLAKAHTCASVIIHKANGEFQEERTYPRASDPHRSKG